jgi:hypothetical protein
VVWIVVAVIVGAFALALMVQGRHDDDLVARLTPLRGQEVVLCIASTATTAKLVPLGEYRAVIAEIDPTTRWVTFDWIEWSDEPGMVGTLDPMTLADTGVIADRIRWVEPHDGPRISLL